MEKYQLEISYNTIFKVIFSIIVVVFLFLTQKLLLALFAGFVISTVTNPIVDWAEIKKIPRTIATILVFLIILIFLGLVFSWIVPSLAREISGLALHFPQYLEQNIAKYPFLERYGLKDSIHGFISETFSLLKDQALGIVFSTVSYLGNLLYVFVALTISFYLTDEKSFVKKYLRKIIHHSRHKELVEVLDEIEFKMGRWFLGQVILSLVSGAAIFLGLTLLGVPFASALAVLAAILRFVPYLGGLISDGTGVLIAFLSSPWLGAEVFLMYYIIQQIESYIIIPMVMQKTVGLNPIIVILAVLSGGQLGGITGALFAIPIAIIVMILVKKLVIGEKNSLAQ
ncbi:MAG: AI-2E family transporter [bacterium]|nr:AI-2E family transporter [bacterium]